VSDLPTTSKGKLARLPAKTREAVNRRLHDGETAAQILTWLNALPEVMKAMELHFSSEPISPQNLSAWRAGGFQKWLAEKEEAENLKERARFSLELAKASGGNLSEGALAQLTGEVMAMVEEIATIRRAGGEIDPKLLDSVNKSLIAARAKELDTQAHALKEKQLVQRDRELALAEDKYQLQFAETFLKFFDDHKARTIAESGDRKEVKMDQLRALLFGKKPAAPPTEAAAA
jgi:hypothetical protein